jgi:small-conductance mechanosensitive channel
MTSVRNRLAWKLAVAVFCLVLPAVVRGDQAVGTGSRPESSPAKAASEPGTEPRGGEAALTDAERIAKLQRSIEEDKRLIRELRGKLSAPDSEYAKAEKEFTRLDGQVESRKKELQQISTSRPREDLSEAEADLVGLETKRKLAKDRFDLAIRERKTLQEQLATLEKKVEQDQAALRKLKGEPAPGPASQPADLAAGTTAAGAPASQPAVSPAPASDQKASAPAPAAEPVTPTPLPLPGMPALSKPAATTPVASSAASTPAPTPELQEARTEAVHKQAQAQEAVKEAQSVAERLDGARKAIALEQNLLQTARERADNAQKTERALYDDLQTQWQAGASHEALADLRGKINEARGRAREAQQEIRERSDRLEKLQEEVASLQADQIAALKQAEQKKKEAESAQKKVERLEDPWAPQNMLLWLVAHGPRIAGIILGMFLLLWMCHLMQNRLVRLLSGRAQHGTYEDQENRARTLVGVFRSAVTVAIFTGGVLMLLTEIGVNIIPLMGGAAVVGLAVAFGAQNLIRDYFYGFMILLENQYTVNDVVQIGNVSGQVENITLRITVLRGLDGTVHFMPNGQITQVSNMTHGWSRALFDIGVSYNADVDQVMQVLIELGKELRRDPAFRGMILEMPEMLGVDQLGDSAVVIKFFMKTKPLKQWTVKREMLRRIKRKFDELGIEIPFPHRTVYHRIEEDGLLSQQIDAWATQRQREPKS